MLLNLLILIFVVGIIMYLFNLFVTMDAKYKTAINVIVGAVVFLYALIRVLTIFGIVHGGTLHLQ